MYSAGVRAPLRCSHTLEQEDGAESRPHMHRYLIEWEVGTPTLDPRGYSVDINAIKTSLSRVTAELDGKHLNDLPAFADRAPSVENLAKHMTSRLREHLGAAARPVTWSMLRIWEDENAWAGYREDWLA